MQRTQNTTSKRQNGEEADRFLLVVRNHILSSSKLLFFSLRAGGLDWPWPGPPSRFFFVGFAVVGARKLRPENAKS